jgi:hypothetical protein
VQRGNLEFGFIYSHAAIYCPEDDHPVGKDQRVAEMILASLQVP